MQCQYCEHVEAGFYCFKCEKYLCQDCVKKFLMGRDYIYTCKQCKGECRSLEELKTAEQCEQRSADFYNYAKQLLGVFAYPFKGEGPLVLLMGVLVFGFLLAFTSINIVLAIVVMPFVAVFSIFCMVKVITDSVIADSPMGLPDVLLDLGELGMDTIRSVFVFLLCFTPAILMADQDLWFWFFICLGLYLLPMALIMSVLENEVWIAHPFRFLYALLSKTKSYIVIPLFWLLLFRVEYFLEKTFIYHIWIWGQFFKAAVLMYFIHVSMRPLGVFYRVYEKDLMFDHKKNDNEEK